jgi:DNA mismatch endonuclease, patch repair protein
MEALDADNKGLLVKKEPSPRRSSRSDDPIKRSALMSRIHGSDTGPERLLRSLLHKCGCRFRLRRVVERARPDMLFPARRVAVFVDGCFWHGCPEHYVRPRTREQFWDGKLAQNVARDRAQTARLEAAGWRVCRVWEHSVFAEPDETLSYVKRVLDGAASNSPAWRVVRVHPLTSDWDIELRLLEDLRDASRSKVVRQRRSTTKWHVTKPT